MVTATLGAPSTAALRTTRVASPYQPAAVSPPAVADQARLSGSVAPSSSDVNPHKAGKIAVGVAAGLAGIALLGILGPHIFGGQNPAPPAAVKPAAVAPVTSFVVPRNIITGVETGQLQPGTKEAPLGIGLNGANSGPSTKAKTTQAQDPVEVITNLAVTAENASQSLPTANDTHAQWSKDLASIKSTAHDVNSNVDAIMRGANDAQHQKAVTDGLNKLQTQVSAFQQRLDKETPGVDQGLGQNRDALNQAGTAAFSITQNIDKAASQYGPFTPQRGVLKELSSPFYSASKDLAMATEKATGSRADDKTLSDNMKVVGQLLATVQKANANPANTSEVDTGMQAVEKAIGITQTVADQSSKEVTASSTLAHKGSQELLDGLQKLQIVTGASQQEANTAIK